MNSSHFYLLIYIFNKFTKLLLQGVTAWLSVWCPSGRCSANVCSPASLKGSLLSLWLPLPPCLSHSVFFHTQPSFRYQPWTQETTESDAWGQFSKMRSCTQFAVLPPKFQSLVEGSKNLVSCSPPGRGLCHEECYHDGKQSQSPAPKEHVDKPEKLKVTF